LAFDIVKAALRRSTLSQSSVNKYLNTPSKAPTWSPSH